MDDTVGGEAADAVEHDREPVLAVGVGHEVSGNEDSRIAPRQKLRDLGPLVRTEAFTSWSILDHRLRSPATSPYRKKASTPGWTRTSDPGIRNPMLYPPELRARRGFLLFRSKGERKR